MPNLKNVPSMSYFMTEPGDAEQGLLEEKHYFRWISEFEVEFIINNLLFPFYNRLIDV